MSRGRRRQSPREIPSCVLTLRCHDALIHSVRDDVFWRWIQRFSSVALALTTYATFLGALDNEFVWDDEPNFLENSNYRGLGWTQLCWMFTTFHMGHYAPLTWVTLGVDYRIWGMNPAGYIQTNLLLHATNVAVFYLVALRLLRVALGPRPESSAWEVCLGATVAALFFALHPLRVESVVWVTERRDVLSALFYLLTILAYLRVHDAIISARQQRWWYWAAVATFVLALLSKSMAVSLPIVLLVLDVYPLRRLSAAPSRWLEAGARRVWLEKSPFVLLSLAASVVAVIGLMRLGGASPLEKIGVAGRIAVSAYSLAFYLWKTVVPLKLSPLYELPTQITPGARPFLASYVVVAGLVGAAVLVRRRMPALMAVCVAYLAVLLPVLGIMHNGPQIAADRYSYLSSLGWSLLAGGAIGKVVGRKWAFGPVRRFRAWALGMVGAMIAFLGVLTVQQVRVWHDTESLWTQALAASPSSHAHYNLGRIRFIDGRVTEAIEHYGAALAMRPAFFQAHNGLGLALAAQGNLENAIEHYQIALRINPNFAPAHLNLGDALARRGLMAQAIKEYREALRIQPGFAEAQRRLDVANASR